MTVFLTCGALLPRNWSVTFSTRTGALPVPPPPQADSARVPARASPRLIRRLAADLLALVLTMAAARPAAGQDWLLINGILEGEAWETDAGSTLLARNDGRPTALVFTREDLDRQFKRI